MNKKTLFVGASAALALALVIAVFVFKNQQPTVEDSVTSNNLTALERVGAPTKGPQEAKVTIVEYFDPACGTGGMLSVSEDYVRELNPDARLEAFGQDYNDQSYAICGSDMMIKG